MGKNKFNLTGHAPTRTVLLNGKLLPLDPSLRHVNHSPDGFNWGYGGSGPSQLAAAITLHLTGATSGYQDLKNSVIVSLPGGKSFDVDIEADFENKQFAFTKNQEI